MSKHIYLSAGAENEKGSFVDGYGAITNVVNYRGKAKSSKEAESFKVKMLSKGHMVITTAFLLERYSVVHERGTDFVVNYPACFASKLKKIFT